MRNVSRQTDPIEWIVISLRWLTLVGLTVGIAGSANASLAALFIILIAAAGNSLLTMLVAFDRRLPFHPSIRVGIDLLSACLLFLFSGGLGGDIGWVIILPSMTASVYFGLAGGAIAALVGLFLLGLLSIITFAILPSLVFLITLIPLCLFTVLFFGSLSNRIRSEIANAQQVSAAGKLDGLNSDSGWLSVMFKLMAELNASLNYQRVLDKALDLSSGALGKRDAA
ncbi:MAG: hypothetical protein ACWGO1_06570, partial [Anaerolineales bacterium]